MYPLKRAYSKKAYEDWKGGQSAVRRQPRKEIKSAAPLEVSNWDELREAVSFLSMMNKRQVLYFRGQRAHFAKCVPVLFRPKWSLDGEEHELTPERRRRYYEHLQGVLRREVYEVVRRIRTPREFIIKSLPSATASILQHYELWPTPFLDVTRSLPTAVSFATSDPTAKSSYLYLFGMPDLRGSITTDFDQSLTISRLEAVCPPAAKRPHHQDAYLVARAPLPHDPNDELWDEWERKSNLMRRLVASFRLKHEGSELPGTPAMDQAFLVPSEEDDVFAATLRENLLPLIRQLIAEIESNT